jgi:hypothetical protein
MYLFAALIVSATAGWVSFVGWGLVAALKWLLTQWK